MLMACLAPREPPGFAKPEYGFHLREAVEWDDLCRRAGFVNVSVQEVESEQITLTGGVPTKRYGIVMKAWA